MAYQDITGSILSASSLSATMTKYAGMIGSAYSLREIGPAGGWIFHIEGSHFWECASEDQSQETKWSNVQILANCSLAFGSGLSNTDLIIAQSGHTGSAAKCCKDYSSGIYDDWYLPSKGEMAEIHANLMAYGIGNWHTYPGYEHPRYWTSSESDESNPQYNGLMIMVLPTLYMGGNVKTDKRFSARAIRDFEDGTPPCKLNSYSSSDGSIEYAQIEMTGDSISVSEADGSIEYAQIEMTGDSISVSEADGHLTCYITIKKSPVYEIGDDGPAGGLIFYNTIPDYYEAAVDDLPGHEWSNIHDVGLTQITWPMMGYGKQNSDIIIGQAGHVDSAANACEEYLGGGYDDWFLPSSDECRNMLLNLASAGKPRLNSMYWTSVENSASTANALNNPYTSGFDYLKDSNFPNSVPVRHFTIVPAFVVTDSYADGIITFADVEIDGGDSLTNSEMIGDLSALYTRSETESAMSAVLSVKSSFKEYYSVGGHGPAGGWVFASIGGVGHECAPVEAELTGIYFMLDVWEMIGTIDGWDNGEYNTQLVNDWIVEHSPREHDVATQVCAALVYGGFHDWYLPTLVELAAMQSDLDEYGIGSFSSSRYWSSVENDSDSVWAVGFGTYHGAQTYRDKDQGLRVRASRTFINPMPNISGISSADGDLKRYRDIRTECSSVSSFDGELKRYRDIQTECSSDSSASGELTYAQDEVAGFLASISSAVGDLTIQGFHRYIMAYFLNDSGVPVTGLHPTIRIWRAADSYVLVLDEHLEEIAGGWYRYDYANYDAKVQVVYRIDGGAVPGMSDRYKFDTMPIDVEQRVDALLDATLGNWKLSAPNDLKLYKPDGVTVVASFKCYDAAGEPSVDNIAEVVRV